VDGSQRTCVVQSPFSDPPACGTERSHDDGAWGVGRSWNHGPDAYHHGLKHNATVEAYQSCALQEGIPDRPHGLFPPNDPYLTSLAKTRGLSPFQVPAAHECLYRACAPRGRLLPLAGHNENWTARGDTGPSSRPRLPTQSLMLNAIRTATHARPKEWNVASGYPTLATLALRARTRTWAGG